MHRTEGPDYIIVSGKRWYKETPTPGTVVNAPAVNSLQEEICGVIEAAGIAVRVDGATDAASNYTGQLLEATNKLAEAKSKNNFWDVYGHASRNAITGLIPSTVEPTANEANLHMWTPEHNGCTIPMYNDANPQGIYATFTGGSSFVKKIFDQNIAGSQDDKLIPFAAGQNGGCCPVNVSTGIGNLTSNAYSPVFVLYNAENGQFDFCLGIDSEGIAQDSMKKACENSGWIADSANLYFRFLGYVYLYRNTTNEIKRLAQQPDGWVQSEDVIARIPTSGAYKAGLGTPETIDFDANMLPSGVLEINPGMRKLKINFRRHITAAAGEQLLIHTDIADTVGFDGQPYIVFEMGFVTGGNNKYSSLVEFSGTQWEINTDTTSEYAIEVNAFRIFRD